VVNVVVVIMAAVLTAVLAWFFFAPRASQRAQVQDGVQVIRITVKGAYSPAQIDVRQGQPVQHMQQLNHQQLLLNPVHHQE